MERFGLTHIDKLSFCYDFRMESLFHLLLHEQNLVQEDHRDEKLINSVEYHWRDLATTLETAKWQVLVYFAVMFFYILLLLYLSHCFLSSWKILKER